MPLEGDMGPADMDFVGVLQRGDCGPTAALLCGIRESAAMLEAAKAAQ